MKKCSYCGLCLPTVPCFKGLATSDCLEILAYTIGGCFAALFWKLWYAERRLAKRERGTQFEQVSSPLTLRERLDKKSPCEPGAPWQSRHRPAASAGNNHEPKVDCTVVGDGVVGPCR